METEMEKNPQDMSAGQQEGSREGFNETEATYSKTYGDAGVRAQRPRIHTQRAYSSDRNSGGNNEEAFRPEGFGAGLQSSGAPQQRPYRPRFNNYNNENGGYQHVVTIIIVAVISPDTRVDTVPGIIIM